MTSNAHLGSLCFTTRTRPYLLASFADPIMMPKIQVDRGAIKFVLSGANVMTPGVMSAGGAIFVELPAGSPVAVYAKDKEHALAVGIMSMSTAEMYVMLHIDDS